MAKGRVWLIGGTQESKSLAQAIAAEQMACVVSITTEPARNLYVSHPCLSVEVAQFDEATLTAFLQQLQQDGAIAIVDASHPFAAAISQLAIAVATKLNIPYLRYERPAPLPAQQPLAEHESTVTTVESLEALLAGNFLAGQRVLLTVGYKSLPLFRPWQARATLFARILPSPVALEAAIAAGFAADRLIALRPPISPDLEKALWQQWRITRVVAKASGQPGGELTKRQIAAELGVQLILIQRPTLAYPQQTADLQAVVQFCRQNLRP